MTKPYAMKTTNNDYDTRTVRIVDFEVVRKEATLVTLRGKYGVEMTTDEKCLFEDGRAVEVGAISCTLADYNWWLAGAWRWHFEKERKRLVELYADHVPLYVWAGDYTLANEDLRNALVPFDIWGVEDLRIGQVMEAWSYGLTAKCPHCGGEGKVYHFCGVPTSGAGNYSLFCPDCGNFSEHIKGNEFNRFRKAVLTAQQNHPATIPTREALNMEEYIKRILM